MLKRLEKKFLNIQKILEVEEKIIKEIITKGDQVQDKRLSEVGR